MNKDNVDKKGKIIVGSTLREKLKAKLKELIRKKMTEISTSGAAGGSPADGSAGPVKTPYAFGKVKDPTTGLDGYKQVGKNETGTITEKKKKGEKGEKGDDEAPKKNKSSGTPYISGVSPKELDPKQRLTRLTRAKQALKVADKATAALNQALTAADQEVAVLTATRQKALTKNP